MCLVWFMGIQYFECKVPGMRILKRQVLKKVFYFRLEREQNVCEKCSFWTPLPSPNVISFYHMCHSRIDGVEHWGTSFLVCVSSSYTSLYMHLDVHWLQKMVYGYANSQWTSVIWK